MNEQLESMAQFFNARSEIYDEVHLGHLKKDGGIASKDIVAQHLPEGVRDILDLGCGRWALRARKSRGSRAMQS